MAQRTDRPRYWAANLAVMIVFAAGGIAIGFYNLWRQDSRAWMGWISPLYLLLPFLLRKVFRLRPAYLMDITLFLFIFLAFDLGVALSWYAKLAYYDLAMHLLAGMVFDIIGLCWFYRLREDRQKPMGADKGVALFFALCFTQLIAVVWEIFEFVSDKITGDDAQNVLATGVVDTMEDLIICLAGALIITLPLYLHLKSGKKSIVFAPLDQFYQVNFGRQ